jgi:hypothetical protein
VSVEATYGLRAAAVVPVDASAGVDANVVDFALVAETDADNPVVGDLLIERGEFVFVTGGDAVAQEVRVRLAWWRGEWFLDLRQGIPYVEQLLGHGVSEATIRAVLRAEIEAVPGVSRVTAFDIESNRATRHTTVDVEILTTEGEALDLDSVALGFGGIA